MDDKRAIRWLSVMTAAALIAGLAGLWQGRTEKIRREEAISEMERLLEEKEERLDELEEKAAYVDLEVCLPERLYVAVGRTIDLYNSQVAFSGTLDEFSFNWECDIGKCLERKYQVTGTESNIGEHLLKLTVYNSLLEPVYEKEAVLEVVDAVINDPVRILNIGDSLSDSTPWYEEVAELSDGKITFVGTRGSGNAMHEGRSGFTICDYRTETEYTYAGEGVQPFFNPDTENFDYSYYKKTTGVEADAVQIFLGKNGASLDPGPGIGWLLEMVEDIRANDPDIPIYLVETIYLGDQNGIGNETDRKGRSALNGWWKLEEDKKIFLWTRAMEETFSEMEGIYLIPAALTYDSAYNYRAAIEQVNARSSRTEAVLMEGLHPNAEGYMQLADTFFSTYCGTMND